MTTFYTQPTTQVSTAVPMNYGLTTQVVNPSPYAYPYGTSMTEVNAVPQFTDPYVNTAPLVTVPTSYDQYSLGSTANVFQSPTLPPQSNTTVLPPKVIQKVASPLLPDESALSADPLLSQATTVVSPLTTTYDPTQTFVPTPTVVPQPLVQTAPVMPEPVILQNPMPIVQPPQMFVQPPQVPLVMSQPSPALAPQPLVIPPPQPLVVPPQQPLVVPPTQSLVVPATQPIVIPPQPLALSHGAFPVMAPTVPMLRPSMPIVNSPLVPSMVPVSGIPAVGARPSVLPGSRFPRKSYGVRTLGARPTLGYRPSYINGRRRPTYAASTNRRRRID